MTDRSFGRERVEIRPNSALVYQGLFIATTVLVLCLLFEPGGDQLRLRMLRPGVIVMAAIAILMSLRRVWPGPSIVLTYTDIRFRRAFGNKTVSLSEITRVGEIRISFGRPRETTGWNPGSGPLNHFVYVHLRSGRPVRVMAMDVSIPLEDFKELLEDRLGILGRSR